MKSASGIPSVASAKDRWDALSAREPAYRRAPVRQSRDDDDVPVPPYAGAERRKSRRRIRQVAILIELRSGRERRRYAADGSGTTGRIDEKA